MILIGKLDELNAHSRFIVSLRSISLESKYHSIVIYGVDKEHPTPIGSDVDADTALATRSPDSVALASHTREWHAMEEECPHLGASMAEAEIEIEDDGVIAICPWHNYDFNLRTGESSSGLTACVLPTAVKEGNLYIEHPTGATDWTLISVRPVSQRFAIPSLDAEKLESSIQSLERPRPESLVEWGALILRTANPDLKVNLTRHAVGLFRKGDIPILPLSATPEQFALPPETPCREAVQMVRPGDVLKRGKGGSLANRIKLLHALANIELWAIDLAWDIITRFAQEKTNGKALPRAFFTDFGKVAEDEAKHFTLLREALRRLGSDWGELPIHDGLWQSARDTSHSLISRICIIHLVHEARGLDVNPTQIKRVRDAGDLETARSLEIIHADEVTHVAAGHRWLCYICNNSVPKTAPVTVFRNEVKTHFFGKLKPPFNVEDRAKAGLDPSFYEDV
ncbi:hypothetical protein PTTG_11783 [Puccinia triticina 1-1 BBBD Race 1]|uniref:Rieske domain-containing protein n=2 Tax=Puccinia triticina TaxID=208348 RepID=A0A180GR81_PUCT1|nr:uncharacterized protein PtA15_7A424 [Puccinia triticina]OAV94792.1 hypothetical protein PTTG_11783 [Puccinia triticina 1-1 BBBD Race 1]WAQ86696.1 hypothetical protein PtA15_7A424 [Puccinia triticina]WAR56562.1 hypothetical protein PtB15_7B411 [Puccinia triticina]